MLSIVVDLITRAESARADLAASGALGLVKDLAGSAAGCQQDPRRSESVDQLPQLPLTFLTSDLGAHRRSFVCRILVAAPGLGPGSLAYEANVLPLHHSAVFAAKEPKTGPPPHGGRT